MTPKRPISASFMIPRFQRYHAPDDCVHILHHRRTDHRLPVRAPATDGGRRPPIPCYGYPWLPALHLAASFALVIMMVLGSATGEQSRGLPMLGLPMVVFAYLVHRFARGARGGRLLRFAYLVHRFARGGLAGAGSCVGSRSHARCRDGQKYPVAHCFKKDRRIGLLMSTRRSQPGEGPDRTAAPVGVGCPGGTARNPSQMPVATSPCRCCKT